MTGAVLQISGVSNGWTMPIINRINMLSTGVMIRTGAVFGNLMVNVKPTNDKLIDRAIRIILTATASDRPIDRPAATRLLIEAGSVKVAIAMQKLSLPRAEAEERLATAGGSLSKALRDNSNLSPASK